MEQQAVTVEDSVGPLTRLSATELIAGYRAKEFTPGEAIDETIRALQKIDDACNVVVTDLFDKARADADRISQAYQSGTELGPLAGVPVTVKDLVFVKDVAAKGGAPSLSDHVAETDAHVVERLQQAGAIVTCKTTTCESGYKLTADSPVTGVTRNPWDRSRTSGGSSGGAAAAVAAGGGPIAVGTDGVGSIRVPSSFCGVFGLKPTFGLVSRAPGFSPPSWGSLAHTGPIARTVADATTMLAVMAGYDVRDAASLRRSVEIDRPPPDGLKDLKIGVSFDLGHAPLDAQVRSAFESAVGVFCDLAASTDAVDLGLEPDILETVLHPIAFCEQAASIGQRQDRDFEDSDADFRAVLSRGRDVSGVDYVEATHRRNALRSRFVKLFGSVDILVTPTVPIVAFDAGRIGVDTIDGTSVDSHLGWSPFTWPINLAGLPAATVPCGFDDAGLPIGLQIVAPWHEENRLLRAAAAFEAARPWSQTWPDVDSGGLVPGA